MKSLFFALVSLSRLFAIFADVQQLNGVSYVEVPTGSLPGVDYLMLSTGDCEKLFGGNGGYPWEPDFMRRFKGCDGSFYPAGCIKDAETEEFFYTEVVQDRCVSSFGHAKTTDRYIGIGQPPPTLESFGATELAVEYSERTEKCATWGLDL